MKWTPEIARLAVAKLQSVATLPRGAGSCFVPLDDETGLKLFPTKEWRDFAYEKQKAVQTKGHAPKTGDKFTLPEEVHALKILTWKSPWHPETQLIYGYMTERADTTRSIPTQTKQALIRKLKEETGLSVPKNLETQDENFGFIGERLVIIDFDYGSWN